MNKFFKRAPTEEIKQKENSATAFISNILNTVPSLELVSDSSLAKVAIKQYNEKLETKATLVRPPIPSWFCGYQDTESGQLYLSDFELDSARIKTINNTITLTVETTALSTVRYDADKCLSLGTPGSYWYSRCTLISGFDIGTELDTIDWSTAFYPTELVTDAIQQITDAVAEGVNNSISAQVEANAGMSGSSGGESGGENPEQTGDVNTDGGGADIPSGTKFLHTNVSGWAVTAKLSASVGGSINLNYNKANVWKAVDGVNANPWVIVKMNDQWYAATFEWFRVGQTSKPRGVLDGSMGDHIKVSPLNKWRPRKGEKIGFMVSGLARTSSRNVKERSNVSWATWP